MLIKEKHEGKRLRKLIDDNGTSVTEFSSALEMTRQNVNHHLRKETLDEDFLRLIKDKAGFVNLEKGFSKKLTTSKGKKSGSVEEGTPVYDIDATAGGNLDFSNQLPETIKGYINLPNFKKCIAFITVRGDSMYPKFRAGDLIGIEPLEDMDIIQWGQVYVVLTMDNQRVLKYVRKGKDENHFILKSENPNYDDMLLNKTKVRKLFMAKGPVRDDWQ